MRKTGSVAHIIKISKMNPRGKKIPKEQRQLRSPFSFSDFLFLTKHWISQILSCGSHFLRPDFAFMCFPLFYCISSDPILIYPILLKTFNFIPPNLVGSCSILSYLILSYSIPSHRTLWYPFLSFLVLFGPSPSFLTPSYPSLSCPTTAVHDWQSAGPRWLHSSTWIDLINSNTRFKLCPWFHFKWCTRFKIRVIHSKWR